MVHDRGGPIGMAVALTNPKIISGLVICNTWCWPLPLYKPPFAWAFSIIFGGPIGKYLNLKRNFFARRILMMGLSSDLKTSEIFKAYTDPFPTPHSRMGTYIFPKRLRMSDFWLRSLEAKLNLFEDQPVEVVWGMKDPVFGRESMIKHWTKYFPKANVSRISDARHLVPEEHPEQLIAAVNRLNYRFQST